MLGYQILIQKCTFNSSNKQKKNYATNLQLHLWISLLTLSTACALRKWRVLIKKQCIIENSSCIGDKLMANMLKRTPSLSSVAHLPHLLAYLMGQTHNRVNIRYVSVVCWKNWQLLKHVWSRMPYHNTVLVPVTRRSVTLLAILKPYVMAWKSSYRKIQGPSSTACCNFIL